MVKVVKQIGMSFPPKLITDLDDARGAVSRSRMVQNCIRIVLKDPDMVREALRLVVLPEED